MIIQGAGAVYRPIESGRFDLMAQLERNPGGLKMNELSARLMVTGGNVTGITDQLVREGLVSREAVASDRRAFLVKLTTAGRRSFQRMAEEHEQWIVDLFGGLDDGARRRPARAHDQAGLFIDAGLGLLAEVHRAVGLLLAVLGLDRAGHDAGRAVADKRDQVVVLADHDRAGGSRA